MTESFNQRTQASSALSTAQLAAIEDQLSGSGCVVHVPGSEGFARATQLWNGTIERKPALVAACSNSHAVRAALLAARTAGLPVSVRNGGRDWVGRALRDGGLVLDLTPMRECSVNVQGLEATVAAGVTVADLNAAVGRHGLAAVIGNEGTVSMTGLLSGGGYGPLTTRFGLAADNLLSAELVLADGSITSCDATHNRDLFWAVQGGGGNFGVITSMRLRLHRVEQVLSGMIMFPWGEASAVLERFSTLMQAAPDELAAGAILSLGPGGAPVVLVSPLWSGDLERGRQIVREIESFGTPMVSKVGPMPASDLLSLTDGKLVSGRGYELATRWLTDLSPNIVSTLIAAYDDRTSPYSAIILHHFHGAGTRVAPEDTAFGMRQPHFTALIYGIWEPAHLDGANHRRWAQDLSSKLSNWALPGGYANLLHHDARDQIGSAFGPNGQRLLELKARFDPDNVFSAIPLPSSSRSVRSSGE
ncbi:FAD-binding oxidoreductase [Pendulispora brunnea]|uniref:FAD-binding oxidoreductase n=1 Tax=Pendulispora brunnea TaxID=2905690 RepID=A0ABZ2KDN9_9BACT